MANGPLEVVGLVDNQKIDPAGRRHLDQPRIIAQHLERDDRLVVNLKRVEVIALVSSHLGDSCGVQQSENLVVVFATSHQATER